MGDDEYDGLSGRISQVNGRCDAARGKAAQLATARAHIDLLGAVAPLVFADTDGRTAPEIPEDMIEKIKEELDKNPELMAMVPDQFKSMLAEANAAEGEPEDEDADTAEGADDGEETPEVEPARPDRRRARRVRRAHARRAGRPRGRAHARPAPQLQGLERVRARRDQHRRVQGQDPLERLGDGLQRHQHLHARRRRLHRRDPGRLQLDPHRALRLLGHRVRLHQRRSQEGPRARGRARARLRDRRGHLGPRPARPPLRPVEVPDRLRQQPDGAGQEASATACSRTSSRTASRGAASARATASRSASTSRPCP
jgi:hypothetical protein